MKSYNSTIGFLLLWGCLLISCSAQKNTSNGLPGWVDNPREYYNPNQYLLGVGSGSTHNEATSDAFASLSQIFQMDINATEELQSEFLETSRNNDAFVSEETSRLLNNVRIGTSQQLMNTSILETQVGPNGTYYALAGMERMESARIYNQEISNNELKINEFEANADRESNVLQKLTLLKKARFLAQANETLSRQYTIIRGGGAGAGLSAQTLNRIEEKFRNVQRSAIVRLYSENSSPAIISSVSEVLQQEGFSIADDSDQEVLDIVIFYDTQEAELNRNDAIFVKWELVVEVYDNQTGTSFNTFMAEGRDGALSWQDALKRADFTARKKIQTEFKSFINQQLLVAN